MRALFLTSGCFDKGGISRYSRYQIEALREVLGSENLKVLSLLGPDDNGFETPFDVDWHGQRASLSNKVLFAAAATKFALASRPDIVHVAHVNLGPLGRSLARLAGARTLLNVYALELWSGLTTRRRKAMQQMTRIVADCHFTADFVVNEGLHAHRPDVVWDCVDLERFTPGECSAAVRQKYNLPDRREHFVIMTLGRLARVAGHKGYDRLIEVFAEVHREVPNARLVIAGRGDDRARLEGLAAQLQLGDAVVFTGAIAECDLADCYRAASVFSLVSDRGHGRGEGIPLTPLEAMACGAAVIVGNQDGSREAVVDGANGYVVGPFDIAAHRDALISLTRSPEVLERMRRAAREVAELHFGYKRFVEHHQRLYAKIMDG